MGKPTTKSNTSTKQSTKSTNPNKTCLNAPSKKVAKTPTKPPKQRHPHLPPDDPIQFNRHLEKRKPAVEFRFRPSVGNSSLLARRARTNGDQLAASTSGSLVPTYGNFVDLVTPEPPTPHNNLMDSGYISLNGTASPPGCDAHDVKKRVHIPPPFPAVTVYQADNIPEYRATMERCTEQIFLMKYVQENFTYDTRKAREMLRPVMRKALDKMEDRPMVDKFYLHVNLKAGTVRGEHRRERFRKKAGQRAVDLRQASWESKDYVSARPC